MDVTHDPVRSTDEPVPPRPEPPEAIEDPPISIERASDLMAGLGFVAFRTPTDTTLPGSCLMAMLRAIPTRQHFDPKTAEFWVSDEGRGRLEVVDSASPPAASMAFSWGRIRLRDRFGMRNGFVSFGGVVDVEALDARTRLCIFQSTAPILRLRGHSQHADAGADEAVSFFGRVLPRLWAAPGLERRLGATAPNELYAAFLLDEVARATNAGWRDPARSERVRRYVPALDVLGRVDAQAVAGGAELLREMRAPEADGAGDMDRAEGPRGTWATSAHTPR